MKIRTIKPNALRAKTKSQVCEIILTHCAVEALFNNVLPLSITTK